MSHSDNYFNDDYSLDDGNLVNPQDDSGYFNKSPIQIPYEYDSNDNDNEQRRQVEAKTKYDSNLPNVDDITEPIARFHSLSYAVLSRDIVDKFRSVIPYITLQDVKLIRFPDGKSSGTAFLSLKSKQDLVQILKYNGESLRGRIMMIMPSTKLEITQCEEQALKKLPIRINPIKSGHGNLLTQLRTDCVHLKNLPPNCNHNSVRRFFDPLRIPSMSVFLVPREAGFRNCEGYIHFASVDDCEKALARHGEMLDDYALEVYPVNREKMYEQVDMMHLRVPDKQSINNSRPPPEIIGARIRAKKELLGAHDGTLRNSLLYSRTLPNRYEEDILRSRIREKEIDNLLRLREIEMIRDREHNVSLRDDKSRFDRFERKRDYPDVILDSSLKERDNSRLRESIRERDRDTLRRFERLDHDDIIKRPTFSRPDPSAYPESLGGYESATKRSREDTYASFNRRESPPILPPHGAHKTRAADYDEPDMDRKPIVRMLGHPNNTLIFDILDFFQGFDLTVDSIKIQCNDNGTPNGKAYIHFPSFSQAMLAIETYNGKFIGGNSRINLALV